MDKQIGYEHEIKKGLRILEIFIWHRTCGPSIMENQALTGWMPDGNYLEKKFTFPSHSAAFAFLARVALLAEKMDHHPEYSGVYNKVNLRLSTHDVGGVTQKDWDLARGIEDILAGG
jgi:4a-hydroxytetrahydrobiopterin dehydratase